ncbi:MAG: TIGR03067 domain-containing protein [Pirellulales bacterium]|nr:TIGR03067 domain-containing protein [Pirellulales bacterium]
MRASRWICVGGCALLAVVPALAGSEQSDASRVQGTWSLVLLENAAMRMEGEQAKGKLEIHGDRASILVRLPDRDDVKHEYTLVLHPLAQPPAFDVRWDDGRVTRGIYRFEGSRWVRCHGDPNGPRPTTFDNAAANGFILSVWERPKPKSPSAEPAAQPADPLAER